MSADAEPGTLYPSWLADAADLLAEPDPGPTPWLVEGLIVDQAIVACVGRWKTTKSYGLLDVCISVATGQPAFGTLAVPEPGPVVFVNEESGRIALRRRLDALCRGRALDPEELRGRLHVSANSRMRLDDPDWQGEIVAAGVKLRPRLFVFDPLARMKSPAREENAQTDMAVLVEFIRHLRDQTGAAIAFVHHTGHSGAHMRGSSDLESAWETRLGWERDGQSPLVTLKSEHREAEAGSDLQYRIEWDTENRSMRFDLVERAGLPSLEDRVLDWLREHGPGTTEDVRAGVGVRKSDVQKTLERLEQAGTTHRGPSGRQDQLGRPIRDKAWHLAKQAALWPVPLNGNNQDDPSAGHRGSVARPVSKETGGTEQPPDDLHDGHYELAGMDLS